MKSTPERRDISLTRSISRIAEQRAWLMTPCSSTEYCSTKAVTAVKYVASGRNRPTAEAIQGSIDRRVRTSWALLPETRGGLTESRVYDELCPLHAFEVVFRNIRRVVFDIAALDPLPTRTRSAPGNAARILTRK